MKILVLNSGSSSIKFQLFNMPQGDVLSSGMVDKIGQTDCTLTYKIKDQKIESTLPDHDHHLALEKVAEILVDSAYKAVDSAAEIQIIGHRVVHGGEAFSQTTEINEQVKSKIKELFSLAPLHNPPNLQGIEVAEQVFPAAKQMAVFDTAFHSSIPKEHYRYAIPNDLYERFGIRVYGFHGTSHRYVSDQAYQHFGLNQQNSRVVSIHLGNGCSMAAILDGQCIDTTMGLGPLAGLVMGTRSGDIDPSIILFLAENGFEINEISQILNKNSGLKGLTGENDMRAVKALAEKGDKNAKLALKIYALRIKKYIGAYTAMLNGLDAIIFTGGIGENDQDMRARICENLSNLGIEINQISNQTSSQEARDISSGRVKTLVIPTNEELEIARQCYDLIRN